MSNKITVQDLEQALKTLENFYLNYTNNCLTQDRNNRRYNS
jgi:hypothetical protein